MDLPRLGKSVRRITVLERDTTGAMSSVVVFERRKKGKKQSRAMRPLERMARMVADANEATATTYLARHKRSNRKRRDGWMRDMPNNVLRAGRKGLREFSITRFLSL